MDPGAELLTLDLTDIAGNIVGVKQFTPTSPTALAIELHMLREHRAPLGRFVHWICDCRADAIEISRTQWVRQLRAPAVPVPDTLGCTSRRGGDETDAGIEP